mgnify:CR=1 FL=1
MKLSSFKLCLIGLCVLPLLFQQVIANEADYSPYPQPDAGYVSDHANLLSADEEIRLERWLLQVEEKSNVEIIVVSIYSLSDYEGTENSSIETFATALFDTYGIGNMPKNDGILLLISKNDRKARIELGKHYGYDHDSDATRIMQNVIIPEFKRGDYPAGITDGTEAIIEEFAGMRITFPWHIVAIAVAGLVCLIIGISCLKNGKRGWGYVFIGIAIIVFLLSLYLLQETLKHSNTAGGAGGFGGGSSGGGGATGSW